MLFDSRFSIRLNRWSERYIYGPARRTLFTAAKLFVSGLSFFVARVAEALRWLNLVGILVLLPAWTVCALIWWGFSLHSGIAWTLTGAVAVIILLAFVLATKYGVGDEPDIEDGGGRIFNRPAGRDDQRTVWRRIYGWATEPGSRLSRSFAVAAYALLMVITVWNLLPEPPQFLTENTLFSAERSFSLFIIDAYIGTVNWFLALFQQDVHLTDGLSQISSALVAVSAQSIPWAAAGGVALGSVAIVWAFFESRSGRTWLPLTTAFASVATIAVCLTSTVLSYGAAV